MAQAGDGTGRSHWHAGYPKSLAVSSKPMNDKITSELHILLMVPFQTGNFRMEYMNCYYLNAKGQNTNDHNTS